MSRSVFPLLLISALCASAVRDLSFSCLTNPEFPIFQTPHQKLHYNALFRSFGPPSAPKIVPPPLEIPKSKLESTPVTPLSSIRIFAQTTFLFAAALTIQSSEKILTRNSIPAIDSDLQKSVDRAMEKHIGTFVVAEVSSGKILASNNLYLAAITLQAPGSTLKPFVLMALLELNRVDPAQKLICHRKLQIGSAHLDCTHPISIAQLNSDDAIAYSCNSYFAKSVFV